jgi:death on curing protein
VDTPVPSAAEAEAVLDGIPVAGRPIEQSLVAAANRAAYGETDPARLAGATLWSVARMHPLADGNKRVSLVLADLVLAASGRRLEGPEEDLVQLAARAAAHAVDEEWVASEIARLSVHGAPSQPFAVREPTVIRRLADDDYRLDAPV